MLAAVFAVAVRPRLWSTGAAQLFVLAPRGWWRRWPPVPTPDAEYLRFRLQTMYGDDGHQPEVDDVVTYLEWCRGTRAALR